MCRLFTLDCLLVRFRSYQSRSSAVPSTNRKLRSVTVANITKNRFINRLFYWWYLFHKDSIRAKESTHALKRSTAQPCQAAALTWECVNTSVYVDDGARQALRRLQEEWMHAHPQAPDAFVFFWRWWGLPSSLLKAQGMRVRLRVYGLSRVEQSQGEKGYARQEETVLFSLRTGAEPSSSMKLWKARVLVPLVHSNDAFKTLNAVLSLNRETQCWDLVCNKWKN